MKKLLIIVSLVVIIGGGLFAAYVAINTGNNKADENPNNPASNSTSTNDADLSDSDSDKGTGTSEGAGSTDTGNGNNDGNASSAASTDQIKIANFDFTPATITVKVGTKVTWTNGDDVKHNVAMDDGADGPSSPMLAKGDTYTYTFNKAGTYKYHCTPHPNMKGTVVVTE